MKAYAKYQGVPKDYNTDEAGFNLGKDKVTASSTKVLYYIGFFYYGIGTVLTFIALLTFQSEILKELKNYTLLLALMALFSMFVLLAEFIQVCIVAGHLGDVAGGLFIGKVLWMMFTPVVFIILCCCYKCGTMFQLMIVFVFGQLIFSSLLPTFLLLFVYPIKVISLVAYVVAFAYFVVYFMVALKSLHNKTTQCHVTVIYTYMVCFFLVYFAAFLLVLLFLLLMTTAAAFASGVYGIIPLFPPVLITAGIWILKRKVLNTKNDQGVQVTETANKYTQIEEQSLQYVF